jgi:cytochrome oxidase Cu insertion factor (SCO1/SenC/PrrC family)
MTTGVDKEASGETGGPSARRGPNNTVLLILGVVVLFAAVFAVVASRINGGRAGAAEQQLRASGLPTDVSTPVANLMSLASVPGRAAPNFSLTDQRGITRSLASFRGHAVVLEFMDPHCTDICPIVSQEFVDAYHDLGTSASKVDFIAVNVNQYHATVADMAAYSSAHALGSVPTWHFFTGAVPELKAIWAAYNIEVEAPNPNADIIHTSIVYFIDAQGKERYVAFPIDEHTKAGTAFLPGNQVTSWGHGVALVSGGLAR